MIVKRWKRVMVLGCLPIVLVGVVGEVTAAPARVSRHARASLPRYNARAFAVRRARIQALLIRRGESVVSGRPEPLPRVLTQNFGVFHIASTIASDASARATAGPAGRFSGVPAEIAAKWGLVVGDATPVTNDLGWNIWLLPGTSGTCIQWTNPAVLGGGGGDCVPNSKAVAGELSPIGSLPSGGIVVIGLAPNGNRTVRVGTADGLSQSVAVRDNVYTATATHGFSTVTLVDSGGAVVTRKVPDGS
jgi:hypothetical protein